ncbi:Armadillo [Macleaya cordata]|uniref:RING-type E3 ubiquitin transferase n=1 Tax=Macleaya cordata TaxID=56857 RepID=A0A200PTU3_MACCD|nr:Armadillo [Macleaya cordata]
MAEPEKTETTSPTMAERITALKKELQILIIKIIEEEDSCLDTFNDAQRILSELRELNFKRSQEIFGDHFRCYISKEIMSDPVVLASGQTYDRRSIQSWLNAGNLTCPKTKQTLSDTNLIPNNLVKDIIPHWCKNQGIKPPANPVHAEKCMSKEEEEEEAQFESLFEKIVSPLISVQKEAAKELRLLTKEQPSFRILFGRSPQIICKLLSPLKMGKADLHPDLQEDLITTVMNISINENNKRVVLKSPETLNLLVISLKTGTINTRSNAAAALFTLSAFEENKSIIGKSGALKSLVELIEEGHPEILKDAAQALFGLCILSENKARAVIDGAIPAILNKIMGNKLVAELLALLALLSSNTKASVLLSQLQAVPYMLRLIKESTSETNTENCITIIYNVCINQPRTLGELRKEANVNGEIFKLAENGTPKAKRKAIELLQRLDKGKMIVDQSP